MLGLNSILEAGNEFVDGTFRKRPDLVVLEELGDLVVVFESFTARHKEVLSVMNVSLFELFVGHLCLSVVFLLFVVVTGTLQLGLEVIEGSLLLFFLNELVVQVLESLNVSDDSALVLFFSSLSKRVVVNLEHFQIVSEQVQVLDGVIQRCEQVGPDGEHIQVLQSVEAFKDDNAVGEQ